MNREELLQEDAFYKVGIKLLSDIQLENIFPNYQALLDKIEKYREETARMPKEYRQQGQYNLMYDNVFSIMGKRGTGKTSVAFTLKKKIEEGRNRQHDVVLPIIIPEIIPDDCSVLVWILAIVNSSIADLEERLRELRKKQEENGSDKKDNYWIKCHFSKEPEDSLSRRMERLLELLFAGKYNVSGESSFYKAVGNSIKQVGDAYRFSCEIVKLWDEWVEKIRLLYQLENQTEEEICPLIFFMFDDVDLEPQKVAELLSIIIKYLSHPNLIVITTADEKMFLEVIENSLDKSIGRPPKEWRAYLTRKPTIPFWGESSEEKAEDDLISQTARMYLGKVLPTSTRYYLRLFERAEDKCWFRLSDTGLLGEVMGRQVDALIQLTGDTKRTNFLKKDGVILKFYMNFMGDTSRQIGNAYLGWKELIQTMGQIASMKETERDIALEKIYNGCRYFLYVGINANHELAEIIDSIDEFVDEIFWFEFNEWKMYVNYSYLSDFLDRLHTEKKEMKKENMVKAALALFSLLILMENILLIMESGIEGGITGRKRIHGISGIINYIVTYIFDDRQLFQRGMGTDEFFVHYSNLLDKLVYIASGNDYDNARFHKMYLHSFVEVPYEEKEITGRLLQKMLNENREWLGEITRILAIVYGNIYSVEKKEISICRIYADEKVPSGYQRRVEEYLYHLLQKDMDGFRMCKKMAERLKELHKEALKEEELEEISLESTCNAVYAAIKKENANTEEEPENEEESRTIDYVPMERVLTGVIQLYGEKTLPELLCMLSNPASVELRSKLIPILEGTEKAVEYLQWIKNNIERWDYYEKRLSIFDFSTWSNKLSDFLNENQEANALLDKLLRIAAQTSGHETDGVRSFFKSKSYYKKVKSLLKAVHKTIRYDSRELEERENLIRKLKGLSADVDAAINLQDQEELKEAVEFSLMVLLYGKLQQVYLAQEVIKKYRLGHRLSPSGLEKMKVRTEARKARKTTEKNTYYYHLYLEMGKIVAGRENEFAVLRTFLSQSADREIRKYLDDLRKEVENEQISY